MMEEETRKNKQDRDVRRKKEKTESNILYPICILISLTGLESLNNLCIPSFDVFVWVS
jgi:hypothetical protein